MSETAESLKSRLRACEAAHAEHSRVRVHRAISWLSRAEKEADDPDAQFLFLWIAFNAAYAKLLGGEESERGQVAVFFSKLTALDTERRLTSLLMKRFTGAVRTLISNKFVYEPFWRALRDHDSSNEWEAKFKASTQAALRALLDGRTDAVLSIVFDRLYVLRNQLVHGGATWSSGTNRNQVKDGAKIMSQIVPAILELMVAHPEEDFGEILYPVV